ncbi:uncharacterized protein TNCT_548161 [Trichonephila clavata]|uniref:Uncharacterized protein n=1 Tax=Trichonephila clavata TaxID=2740835 RepID=A0A8X6L3R9_TRICU|nr:uncharacterized protein TNCT_548161 [Trichonephila clavata]
MTQKQQVIHEANYLLKDLSKKENIFMAGFWAVVLNRINGVNKSLQTKSTELQTSINLLDFSNLQREMFYEFERKENEEIDSQYTEECKRMRIRKRHYDDGDAKNVVFQGNEKLKIETYRFILDNLYEELSRRLEAYCKIFFLFGFLVDFPLRKDSEIKTNCPSIY